MPLSVHLFRGWAATNLPSAGDPSSDRVGPDSGAAHGSVTADNCRNRIVVIFAGAVLAVANQIAPVPASPS